MWLGPVWSYATVGLGPRSNAAAGIGPLWSHATVWLGSLWSQATVGLGPRSNSTGDRSVVEPCNCMFRSQEQGNWG